MITIGIPAQRQGSPFDAGDLRKWRVVPEYLVVDAVPDASGDIASAWFPIKKMSRTPIPVRDEDVTPAFDNVVYDYDTSAFSISSAILDIPRHFPIEPDAKSVANSIANEFRATGLEAIADGFRALYAPEHELSITAIRDAAHILKHHPAAPGALTGLESDNSGVVHLRWDNDAESLTIMVACLARHRVRYFVREKGELRCDAACHSDDTVDVLRTFFDRL